MWGLILVIEMGPQMRKAAAVCVCMCVCNAVMPAAGEHRVRLRERQTHS